MHKVSVLLLWFITPALYAQTAHPKPGQPVDYGPLAFYPERWQAHQQNTMLYPWEGKQLIFLTTKNDLDPKVMGIFLDRLDAAWSQYADMVGRSPNPYKLLNKKPLIAAVPDGRLTCGYGCGMVGATGIEVAAFYSFDYPQVTKQPKAFPHYYFYEMGRNYYVFGDRHSSFVTGFAVFMRYVCMDAVGCEDQDRQTRKQIEAAIDHYVQTNLTFLQAFTMQGGMDEKTPRLKGVAGPSDQPVMYASAMLRLRKELGEAWLKRFYRELAQCPEIKPNRPDAALQQCTHWMVAASVAAKKDLSTHFVDQWRLPMSKATRDALAGIPWNQPGLTTSSVLQKLSKAVSQ